MNDTKTITELARENALRLYDGTKRLDILLSDILKWFLVSANNHKCFKHIDYPENSLISKTLDQFENARIGLPAPGMSKGGHCS